MKNFLFAGLLLFGLFSCCHHDDDEDNPGCEAPDLVATIEQNGATSLQEQGTFIPVTVTVTNQGDSPADIFKVSIDFETPDGFGPFLVSFLMPDGSTFPGGSFFFAFTEAPLLAGASVSIDGNVLITSPNGDNGDVVILTALADSCAAEEFTEPFCRIEECDEENNTSEPLTVTIEL